MAPGRSRSSPEAACKLPPTARPGHDHRHVRAIALCRLHGVDAAVRASAMLALSGSRGLRLSVEADLRKVLRGASVAGMLSVLCLLPAIANRQHRRRMAGHGADRHAGHRGVADPLWTGLDPAGGGDAAGAVPVSAAPAGLDMAARARLGPGPAAAGAERARRDGGGQDRPAPRAGHAALPGGRFLAGVAAGLPADPAAMDGARLSRRCHGLDALLDRRACRRRGPAAAASSTPC